MGSVTQFVLMTQADDRRAMKPTSGRPGKNSPRVPFE